MNKYRRVAGKVGAFPVVAFGYWIPLACSPFRYIHKVT